MELCLSMASNFHSSPEYWLDLPLVEMNKWAMVAMRMLERETEKHNVQVIKPGL
jgi:hypothetical protein